MKIFSFLIVLLFAEISYATTYYFSSSSGDDSRSSMQAQNPATPWKSLTKLNSYFNNFNLGDSILLRRGDTFYGSIRLTKSGTTSLPITISAYGSGSKPVISGLASLSNWALAGNGIYESYNPSLGSAVNTVLINNNVQQMGRYPNSDAPNKGYLIYDAFTNTSITDNELPSSTNWTGAEVVIRKLYWIMDRNIITSHSGNTLNFISGSGYSPWQNKSGYFIQNDIKTLDQFGEWYYNPANKKLYVYFGSNEPSNYNVEASTVDYLVSNAWSVGGIVFNNLAFKGSNLNAIQLAYGDNISIDYCDVLNAGVDAIKCVNSVNFKLENSSVLNANNNGVSLEYENTNATVRNNKIENTHLIAGMGKSGDGNGIGVQIVGKGNLVEYNEILNSGYSGVFFSGPSIVIKNNFINNYCVTKDDGAGIYTNTEPAELSFTGRKITGNVILNGKGVAEGLADGVPHAHGIYLDGLTTGLEVTGNTVANNASYGIFCPNPNNVNINNNTVYNNRIQFVLNHSIKNFTVYNNAITNNSFVSKTPTQAVSSLTSIADDINSFGSFDNNYYARPFDDRMTIQNQYVNSLGTISEVFDLETWRAKYNKDALSKRSPIQYPLYTVNGVTGSNTVTNGSFNSNINGVGGWSALNNMVLSHTTSVMDGGGLQVAFNAATGAAGSSLITMDVGGLTAHKKYLLKFSLKGSNDNQSVGVFLRKNGGTYEAITSTQYRKIGTSRTENELLFSVPQNEPDAAVVFTIDNQDIKFWLDNIQFTEADITVPNFDDFIRFEYNSTNNTKTFPLIGSYVDLKNSSYANSVTLQPYSSIILLKTSQTSANTDQTITFASLPDRTFGDAPFAVNATASSGLPVNVRIISGPATISGNTITTTGTGTVVVEASQPGNATYNAAPIVTQSFLVAATGDVTPPTITPKNITVNAGTNGQVTIHPSDVIQSITDNTEVNNSSITVSQLRFECTTPTTGTPTVRQAYIATTTTGTQNFGGELGMEFRVNNVNGITISQLGAFDHQGNGITGTQNGGIRVAIFNKSTRTIVPGLDAIIVGNADAYAGNHRMKNITPVTLMPGDYVIVTKGYNQNELNGNSAGGAPFTPGDLGNGAISYATSCLYGTVSSNFNYPTTPDGGPGNRYLAGTFSYAVMSGTTTISTATSNTVVNTPTIRQAYIATTTTGTQNFGGELGMEFKVNNSEGITISQLGAFDHQGNGITGNENGGIRVAIFNKSTRTIVPGLDAIIVGNADAYAGNHRMKNITPVTLMPGDYVVVTKGYNANELNGNSGGAASFAPGDLGNGAISYAPSCLYGTVSSNFNYPTTPDGGPGNRYLAGTFSYSVLGGSTTISTALGTPAASIPTVRQAYIATTTTGTQDFGGELGMEFKVNNAGGITISQLGAFDHQGNGITGTQSGGIRVAIFNKSTRTIVPGLDAFIVGHADAYVGNHRMKNVAPVTLKPGDYVVVTKGYNANELNGNSGGGIPFPAGDLGNGAISYATSCLYGTISSNFNYPTTPDGGPGNRYLAGTFSYAVVTSSTTNSATSGITTNTGNNNHVVTITAKDIYGNIAQATATVTVVCNAEPDLLQAASVASRGSLVTEPLLNNASRSFKVFPNPTKGPFSVQLPQLSVKQISIQILTESGRLITQKTLNVNGSTIGMKTDFDLSNQASGMYLVKIVSAEGVQISRVIVAR